MRRILEAHDATTTTGAAAGSTVSEEAGRSVERTGRVRNYDEVADMVAEKVKKTAGRISAKRLLPAARAAGYAGSPRNFRRLVADAKGSWRLGQARAGGRRPAVWTPGETLVIDWGVEQLAGRDVHVFCAVLADALPAPTAGVGGLVPDDLPEQQDHEDLTPELAFNCGAWPGIGNAVRAGKLLSAGSSVRELRPPLGKRRASVMFVPDPRQKPIVMSSRSGRCPVSALCDPSSA